MCFLSCRPLSTAEGDPCSLYRRSDSPRSPLLSERTGKKNIWCHQTVKSCLNEALEDFSNFLSGLIFMIRLFSLLIGI